MEVVTYVEHEGHPLFMLAALLVLIIFGLLSFIILPIGYLVTKNAVHRCSRCLQKMGEKRCFGIPTNFSDEVRQTHPKLFLGIPCEQSQQQHPYDIDLAIQTREVPRCRVKRVCSGRAHHLLSTESILRVHET